MVTEPTVADIALDANVLVAMLDSSDGWSRRANALGRELSGEGHKLLLLDFLVTEAVTVVSRRVTQAAVLATALAQIRLWKDSGEVWFLEARELFFNAALGVVLETDGRLSFNDALLVVLHREGVVDDIVTFDSAFDSIPGLQRIH
jgi:predicted nucleic acid-binding protein